MKTQAEWKHEFIESIKRYPGLLPKVKVDDKLTNPVLWWVNPINIESLRLSRDAFRILRLLPDYKFYKIRLEEPILSRTYLQLEKLFEEIYYIENKKTIHLIGEKDVMMVTLHDNNLQKYLDNCSEDC